MSAPSSGSSAARGRRAKSRRAVCASKPGCNPDESPLAWLARRTNKDGTPMITEEQFRAGERLRADFWLAHMTPRVTVDWSVPALPRGRRGARVRGLDYSERTAAARERIRRALAAVGPELSGILVDVCCHLQKLEGAERAFGWPQRSAKLVLSLALTSLARHYGLLEPEPGNSEDGRPVRVRHWGAADYRPSRRAPPLGAGD